MDAAGAVLLDNPTTTIPWLPVVAIVAVASFAWWLLTSTSDHW
jgi:hypothetical protein